MTSSVGLMNWNNTAMHAPNVGTRPHTNLDQKQTATMYYNSKYTRDKSILSSAFIVPQLQDW